MDNIERNIRKFSSNNKNKSKRSRFIIIFLFFILLVISIYLLFNLSIFDVTDIEVIGNLNYSSDEIIKKSEIKIGENIFGQVLFVGDRKIREFPYIESTKFEIKSSGKLKIKVTERISTYYALDKEKNIYYHLSSDGVILEQAEQRNDDEIIITGISFDDNVNYGDKINEIYIQKLKVYEKIKLEYEASQIGGTVTKVGFENSLTTIVLNDKLSIIFPNATNLKYNIAVLKEILKNIGEDSVGVIDLNKDNPTFSNF